MVDRDRAFAKLDELRGYLAELRDIRPRDLDEYRQPRTRRACERLLQVSVECVLDICNLVVKGRRLGLPAEDEDVLDKLAAEGIVSAELHDLLKRMMGCRNILVHEYGRVLDEIVFEIVSTRLDDFARFEAEMLEHLRSA